MTAVAIEEAGLALGELSGNMPCERQPVRFAECLQREPFGGRETETRRFGIGRRFGGQAALLPLCRNNID